jgi:hypothetical protein
MSRAYIETVPDHDSCFIIKYFVILAYYINHVVVRGGFAAENGDVQSAARGYLARPLIWRAEKSPETIRALHGSFFGHIVQRRAMWLGNISENRGYL